MNSTGHYAKAEALLAYVDDLDPDDAYSRALITMGIAQAQVHATLAQCTPQTAAAAATLAGIRNGVRRAETAGERL